MFGFLSRKKQKRTPMGALPPMTIAQPRNGTGALKVKMNPRSEGIPRVTVDALPPASASRASYPALPHQDVTWGGEKFSGGIGSINVYQLDYWTLRRLSAQLFRDNLYARGLIRRLVTNVIGPGLSLECMPDEIILGLDPEELGDWSDGVEALWDVWANDPLSCDALGRETFGQFQATVYREALLEGDVLLVMSEDPETGLPRLRLVPGSSVSQPMEAVNEGRTVRHGVEVDADGRHVAFWVRQEKGGHKRVPAYGASGRRVAWLYYGTDKRHDDVRGEPLLALVVQSLRELDRYKDSTMRAAVVKSMIAVFMKRDIGASSSVFSGEGFGAVAAQSVVDVDGAGNERRFTTSDMMPGVVMGDLGPGEEPHGFVPQVDVAFGPFEEAMIQAIAWANETPPEILRLSFSNNYSASMAAINEFIGFLLKEWNRFGHGVCAPVQQDWFVGNVLRGLIRADGFLDARRDPSQRHIVGAWMVGNWLGNVKPTADPVKLVKALTARIEQGLITRAEAARMMGGGKYRAIVRQLSRENAQLADALAPLQISAPSPDAGDVDLSGTVEEAVRAVLDERGVA